VVRVTKNDSHVHYWAIDVIREFKITFHAALEEMRAAVFLVTSAELTQILRGREISECHERFAKSGNSSDQILEMAAP
jgi:hypothetical protein